jgi:large subunit ribosomal protein L53
MITRYLTEVSTVFNPFSTKGKAARLFLSFLPSAARQSVKVSTQILPRTSREKSWVNVKFSMFAPRASPFPQRGARRSS